MTDKTTESAEPPVLLERQGAVATIRFNRPKQLNAIDAPLAEHFLAATREIAEDASLRVVVLAGAGKHFMAGGDLAVFRAAPTPETARSLIEPLHEAILTLARLQQPVVACLKGAVAGAGLSVALSADLAIAADDCRFTTAYARIGASLDGSSTWFLPRVVGLRKALELALLAEPFDAAEALRLGLVNRVVPAAEIDGACAALAERLAAGPTHAYGRIKRLLRASSEHDLPAQLDDELEAFCLGTGTADFVEGISAFLEKRPAKFSGK